MAQNIKALLLTEFELSTQECPLVMRAASDLFKPYSQDVIAPRSLASMRTEPRAEPDRLAVQRNNPAGGQG